MGILARLGTGLGCDWLDILVSPNGIMLTTSSGQEFRTKIRRVKRMGVNMSVACELEFHRQDAKSAKKISRAGLRLGLYS